VTRVSLSREARVKLTLTAKVAWWVRPYLHTVALFAWMTGMTPDFEKVAATVKRGVKVGT
jgi:hypothetical protein